MPSPFPGMNPYLEQESAWQDFHQTFIPAARATLIAQLQPNYFARLEEYLFIHEQSADERFLLGRADVGITPTSPLPANKPAYAAAAPRYGHFIPTTDVERHSYIEIRNRQDQELITVIELLSPSNKKLGADREQYLGKRRQLLGAGVHLVELDLLRGGPRLPLGNLSECDCCAIVARAQEYPRAGIWEWHLRQPLPVIPVPLRPPDPDAALDLRQVLDRAYDDAGYAQYIYSGTPHPPLHPDDAEWAKQFLPRT